MNAINRMIDSWLNNRVLMHTLYWVVIFISAPITSTNPDPYSAIIYRTFGMPFKLAGAYFLIYYLFPKYLVKKKYVHFLLLFVLSSFILVVFYRWCNIHISESIIGYSYPKESLPQILEEWKFTIMLYLPRLYLPAIGLIILKLIKGRITESQSIEELKKEKAQAELHFLKSQIHPHFLFNTLNNLYTLTLEKSDQAPQVVEHLSSVLDTILYRSRTEKVPIQQEIDLIEDYIALEKIRFGDRLKLTIKYELVDPQTPIAPLLLLTLMENAFKHGVNNSLNESFIDLFVSTDENGRIDISLKNSKTNPIQSPNQSGIGLKNMRRQLELIYPNNHELQVQNLEGIFQIKLWIEQPNRR